MNRMKRNQLQINRTRQKLEKKIKSRIRYNIRQGHQGWNNATAISDQLGMEYERIKEVLSQMNKQGRLESCSGIYYL